MKQKELPSASATTSVFMIHALLLFSLVKILTWEMKKWILISSTGCTKIGFSIKKFDDGEINYIFLLLSNRVFGGFLPSSAWCTQKLLCAKLSLVLHSCFLPVLLLIFKLKSLEIDENNGVVLFFFVIIPLFYCKNANSFVCTKMWENPFRSASSFSSFFSVSF